MQRTVKTTTFTYLEAEMVNGEIKTEVKTIEVLGYTKDKAYKKAVKKIGNFKPLNIVETDVLYKLDDDIFFKYATRVE